MLKGEYRPASNVDRIHLAELCSIKRLPAASVRFYTEALVGAWLVAPIRYPAACSAALAGCGQGEDAATVPDKVRTSLRKQALEWLRADLAALASRLKGGRPQDRAAVQSALHTWRSDPALAGVRDSSPLAALLSAERAAWQQLWTDVAALLAKARDGQ
jgi:hypothetical protein